MRAVPPTHAAASGRLRMRLAALLGLAVVAGAALVVPGAGTSAGQRSARVTVAVDLRVRYQTMAGFGASERVWSDPHMSDSQETIVPPEAQREILTAAFRRLGLTRLRPVIDNGIEPVNDNSDPRSLDRSKLDFSGKHLDAHVALIQQARAYGLTTWFPSPVTLEPWLTEDNPEEYVELALAMLLRWRELGAEPPYFSPINEPGYWRGGNRSPEWLRRVVVGLGERMRAAGLRTRLVIPDDLNSEEAYKRAVVVLADPRARQYVGALAYHLYGGRDEIVQMRRLAQRYGIPVWMTEYTDPSYTAWPAALDWSVKMHDLITRGNVSAVDYFWAFSSDKTPAMIGIDFEDGVYRSYSLRPIYFLMGQFSRFVEPGDRRVAATPRAGGVLTSAFTGPARRLVVVAVNPGVTQQSVVFSVAGGTIVGRLAAVRTSRDERWRQLPAVRPGVSGFRAVLPPQSVTTFVARTVPRP